MSHLTDHTCMEVICWSTIERARAIPSLFGVVGAEGEDVFTISMLPRLSQRILSIMAYLSDKIVLYAQRKAQIHVQVGPRY